MSRTIYALRVRHTPEGIRLPERDYRHDVWSLIQAAAVRVTYRAPLYGWEPYTAVYEVEDTQGWTTLYAVQAATNLCHREPCSTRQASGALSPFTAPAATLRARDTFHNASFHLC